MFVAFCATFGLKVGAVGTVKFEERIRELVEDAADLATIMEPLLAGRRKLREEFVKLDRQVLKEAEYDPVCKKADDSPRCRSDRCAGLYVNDRHSASLSKLTFRRNRIRADAGSQSIGRKPPNRPRLAMR